MNCQIKKKKSIFLMLNCIPFQKNDVSAYRLLFILFLRQIHSINTQTAITPINNKSIISIIILKNLKT